MVATIFAIADIKKYVSADISFFQDSLLFIDWYTAIWIAGFETKISDGTVPAQSAGTPSVLDTFTRPSKIIDKVK